MAVQLLNNGPLKGVYGVNPEEDEHTLAVIGACGRILGNGDIIIVVATICRHCSWIC